MLGFTIVQPNLQAMGLDTSLLTINSNSNNSLF